MKQQKVICLGLLCLFSVSCASRQPLIEKSRSYGDEIRWPENYRPEDASFYVHNAIEINANPQKVWEILVNAEDWPNWYEGASNVKILDGKSRLELNAAFTWTTMDLDFKSTIREFEPYRRLAWESEKTIIKGWHAWLIIPKGSGCIVVTDEAQRGFLTFFEKIFVPNKLSRLHDVWLAGIKKKAEAPQ